MKRIATVWLAVGTVALAAEDAGVGAVLSVKVGVRSDKGKVACTLYQGPEGFPTKPELAKQKKWCTIEGSAAVCRFDPIPAGTYAVSCFHDENDDGKLNAGLFGIPKEGVSVSNNAKGSFGPPKYADAKFEFPGTPTQLSLESKY